ncbi:MAG TPA: NADH-quinone oxidoreductase subunit C [Mycobacteriales bacterium]|nr:NADH-quinone oxidoreductase subunit C [Mycobacteriales bacterium]
MRAGDLLVVVQQLLDAVPAGSSAVCSTSYDEVTVDLAREHWVSAVQQLRDDPVVACRFFDTLTAVDEVERGFQVMLRLWSGEHRHALQLRTHCPREDARVPSIAGVFAGASWHERHVWEMFGIAFDGHPQLVPLLLPDGFRGQPLRKEFSLASRVEKPWPGAKGPERS